MNIGVDSFINLKLYRNRGSNPKKYLSRFINLTCLIMYRHFGKNFTNTKKYSGHYINLTSLIIYHFIENNFII